MRKVLIIAIVLVCIWISTITFAFAFNEEKHKNVVPSSENKNSAEDKKNEKLTSGASTSVEEQIYLLNEKVRKLEELIEKQQQIIKVLQTKSSQSDITDESAASTASVIPTVISKPEFTKKQQEQLESLVRSYGAFNISGDLRFRFNSQFDQGFDSPLAVPDRYRVRMRVRLQLAGQFNKNFDWAIRVGTGSFTNPISTNQTATDFFNRKTIGFDRYFIRYDSKAEKGLGLILQGGKFDFPWKRTELTFDNVLQPEGAAETIYYKGNGLLKDARVVAFQLPFNEIANGKDSVLFGGQLQTTLSKGNWAVTNSVAYLNFNQADAIARALNRPNTQIGGGFEFGTTNRVRRDSAGNIIGFLTNFNILDIIGELRYTRFDHYPVVILFNYARNMSGKLEKLKERNAYWTEFKIGQTKEKGDVELTYTFARTQQEAVLSVFNYDNFLATNSRNSRASFAYTLNKNIYFQITSLFSERFNVPRNVQNRTTKRILLDVHYKF